MPISSYMTQLMTKDEDTWSKLIDVKSTPDLGGEPEQIDVTTLTDSSYVYIPGIQTMEAGTYVANYGLAEYKKLKALEGQSIEYAEWLGPDGVDGKFKCTGKLSVYLNGTEVNAAREMTITITPSTPWELDESV